MGSNNTGKIFVIITLLLVAIVAGVIIVVVTTRKDNSKEPEKPNVAKKSEVTLNNGPNMSPLPNSNASKTTGNSANAASTMAPIQIPSVKMSGILKAGFNIDDYWKSEVMSKIIPNNTKFTSDLKVDQRNVSGINESVDKNTKYLEKKITNSMKNDPLEKQGKAFGKGLAETLNNTIVYFNNTRNFNDIKSDVFNELSNALNNVLSYLSLRGENMLDINFKNIQNTINGINNLYALGNLQKGKRDYLIDVEINNMTQKLKIHFNEIKDGLAEFHSMIDGGVTNPKKQIKCLETKLINFKKSKTATLTDFNDFIDRVNDLLRTMFDWCLSTSK